jgi:Xaa-Pro dipeptidase
MSGETAQPQFTAGEMLRRRKAVASQLAERGLDAVLVTQGSSFQWLTNHDANGAYMRPYVLVVNGDGEMEAVVREYDLEALQMDSPGLTGSTYRFLSDFGPAVASAVRRLVSTPRRLGMELGAWGLAPGDVTEIQANLGNPDVVDATDIVATVADVKSPEEIVVQRRAAGFADIATQTLFESLADGVTEAEAETKVQSAMHAVGSFIPLGAGLTGKGLGFGKHSAYPHSIAGDYKLAPGDAVWTERGGFVHGYAAGLCRTAVLGRNKAVEDLYKLTVDCTEVTISSMVAGAPWSEPHRAASEFLSKYGYDQNYRTGYSIGINWWTRGHGTLEPGFNQPLLPGMIFHIPRVLFQGRDFAVSNSETILITEAGPERLGTVPAEIFHA